MKILKNIDLKKYNTFATPARAKHFFVVEKKEDIFELKNLDFVILGKGSNILFKSTEIENVAICEIKGIEILSQNENEALVEFGAGEDWQNLIDFCLKNGFWGLENLSGIPSSVGAAPIQNIGAYGVEQSKCFEIANGIDLEDFSEVTIGKESCEFGYRDSIFKRKKIFLTSVIYKFSKNPDPVLTYGPLKEFGNFSQKQISEKIIEIRNSKLPNYKIFPNAGSFFKNPIIEEKKFLQLKNLFPEMPCYDEKDGKKIPAAFLIDKANLKGYKIGKVGTHSSQPLVIINFGTKGQEVYEFGETIRQKVYEKFGIILEMEVNVI